MRRELVRSLVKEHHSSDNPRLADLKERTHAASGVAVSLKTLGKVVEELGCVKLTARPPRYMPPREVEVKPHSRPKPRFTGGKGAGA